MTDAYKILIEPRASKHLGHIDPVIRRRIGKAIDALAANPRPEGCKPLKSQTKVFRIRVGDYRVLYVVDADELTVDILDIDHRKDISR